ncbi:hypothetical protein [Agromyces sp. Soil535]|uniref:hypothetical protein n=1 Tax=Agromyces sp. Soil535 TaxID=1736390 RepID=UPI0006F5F147|nr:hypothetical protein [Agromyces sp. Soil535]KRE22321.1 hypothetical protein ASG80_10280 [Agromyces sp. Soil535]
MSEGDQPGEPKQEFGELIQQPRDPVQQSDEPMRRTRGRHAEPAAAPSGDGWRARVASVLAPVVASAEPRIAATAAWLFERRMHVLIVSATVATIAMLGGTFALISFAGAQQPEDEATRVLDTSRPTSTDPDDSNTYAPILPSPGPTPTLKPGTPTPTPSPTDDPDTPVEDAPTQPSTEPTPTEEPRRETAPGATNRPDKPKD